VDVVGTRRDVRTFLDMLEAIFGLDEPFATVQLETYPSVQRLTGLLHEVPSVPELIGKDLEVYAAVRAAMDAVESKMQRAEAPDERRAGARR
jgi:hypothetical protein